MLLTDFDALTFDCYGTLIDWASATLRRSGIGTCCRSSTSASPRSGVSTRLTRIASSMGGRSEIGRRSKILRGVLQYLKKYYKLVILSNVDNETFQASNRRLQVDFDAIYTAEDIGSYKPSARNFDYMIEKLE